MTIALANGKTETWVQDRTGHKSSVMINLYRRQARKAAELNLGPLKPLHEAIPDLSQPSVPAESSEINCSASDSGERRERVLH